LRFYALIAVLITGTLLIYAASDFPGWGDPHSPASTYLSPHYIEKVMAETSVPNFVTAVLADYRGFDTMFETAVIFTAGIAIFSILRRKKEDPIFPAKVTEPIPNIIVQSTCRILVPIIQLFGLYVVAHGHHSPGGGFQGGVILGASLILLAISYDLKYALKGFSEKMTFMFANAGVLIYAGFGVMCIVLGRNFLDYGVLHKILPLDEVGSRSFSMLGVEIGVAFTVMSIMFAMYALMASQGEMEEGI